MFLEAVIPRDDLQAFLARVLPVTILLDGAEGSHSLALSDPREIAIVPDKGVRLVCKAHVHWPILGIDAPLTLNEIGVLLIPTVRQSTSGETLVFQVTIEHLDVRGVPGVFDEKIACAVNERIAASHVELAWDFSSTFTRVIPLPSVLTDLDALTLRAAWGQIKMTQEAVVFALSLHTEVVRVGDAPSLPAQPSPDASAHALSKRAKPVQSRAKAPAAALATAAVVGFAAGIVFLGLRRLTARWS